MAFDIPQIAVVGVPEDKIYSTPTPPPSSPSPDAFRRRPSPSGHAASPTDSQGFLSLPTPILKSGRNSLDAFGSPTSHASDTSSRPQPPPSPTPFAHSSGSIRFATSTVLRENNPEEHDGLSLLAPNRHRPKGSVTTVSSVGSHGSSTTRDVEDRSFPLSPAQVARGCELPSSSQHTHEDAASSEVPSRSSSPASLPNKKTLHRVRRPSPYPTSETDTNSDTTRNDGPKVDLDVHPFAFKPLQLASLVDPKSLDLESVSGVDGPLRGLETQHNHDLSTKRGMLPSHPGSPDSASQDSGGPPPPVEKESVRPNIPLRSSEGVYERVFQRPRVLPKLEAAPTSAGPRFTFAVDPVCIYFKRVWCTIRSILGF